MLSSRLSMAERFDTPAATAGESPGRMNELLPWRVAGTYFESCNCEAICPCRMIGAKPGGGRSTYGVCFGALSWAVADGFAGEHDLSGLAVVLVLSYDDDEPGSPWTIVLHVDQRADEAQHEALRGIFLGELPGNGTSGLPWIRKACRLVAVRRSRIEVGSDGGAHELRVGDAVTVRASRRVETEERVACGIPGYHIAGTELYADELTVADDPFAFELSGNCAFVSRFEYAS